MLNDFEMDEKKNLRLNDIESYKIAFNLSNYVWDVVLNWDSFAKDKMEIRLSEQWILFLQILQKVLAGTEKKIR